VTGEVVMTVEDQFIFRPVAVVRTVASDNEVREGREESESTVEVFPEYEEALEGLDGFSHIFVLSYFHKLRPEQIGPLKVRPRKLLRAGFKLEELPLVGVFSTDSPTRPNPIGLSLGKLLRREGRKLVVLGLDLFDGTPVLDIKPYREDHRIDHYDVAEWYQQLAERAGRPI
jgi:tRNA-Thr(GGU) m(6)t(6)A37 methyltransferase TsaA